ncbi:MAG TPA: nuclear transport factor 2 family protein [Candidatus Binataceae bacterium]|nr:nuclear transport factor 2 family protein [Candidatus Binataceae bacterium]
MTDDSQVQAALDAQARLGDAMRRLDLDAVEKLFAPDLVVHAPINAVVNRSDVLARLRGGKIGYEESERQVEFAEVRGDSVVIMGLEVVRPRGDAPHAGKTVHRRFTDIWKDTDAGWTLAIRQATIISIE